MTETVFIKAVLCFGKPAFAEVDLCLCSACDAAVPHMALLL